VRGITQCLCCYMKANCSQTYSIVISVCVAT